MLTIHLHASPEAAFYVNSFILEGEKSLVIVDTQFLVSSAAAFAAMIASLHKPVAAIVITHPHPDHYNGLPQIAALAPAAPIYATEATIAGITATQAAKRQTWLPVHGDDYPKTDAVPNTILQEGARLEIDGIVLEVSDLGPAEASDNIAIFLPQANALLASDFIYSACHPWLAEMRSLRWLAALDQLRRRFGGIGALYPGHGPAGDIGLIEAQRSYIRHVRALVWDHLAASASLSDDAVSAIHAALAHSHKDWPLAALIDLNSRALAQELLAEQRGGGVGA